MGIYAYRASRFLVSGIVGLALLLVHSEISAATLTYSFDSSTIVELRNGVVASSEQEMFSGSDTITVTFDYDNSAAGTNDSFGTLYQNLSNISASVGGFNHTDNDGSTLVSNDRWPDGGSQLVDAVLLQSCRCALPALDSPQVDDGTGETFFLLDVRLFWGENFSGTDFLGDESLMSLPPADGGSGAIALVFATLGEGLQLEDEHVVRGSIVGHSVIPVPAAAWLFVSGLGLLGFIRRHQASSSGRINTLGSLSQSH